MRTVRLFLQVKRERPATVSVQTFMDRRKSTIWRQNRRVPVPKRWWHFLPDRTALAWMPILTMKNTHILPKILKSMVFHTRQTNPEMRSFLFPIRSVWKFWWSAIRWNRRIIRSMSAWQLLPASAAIQLQRLQRMKMFCRVSAFRKIPSVYIMTESIFPLWSVIRARRPQTSWQNWMKSWRAGEKKKRIPRNLSSENLVWNSIWRQSFREPTDQKRLSLITSEKSWKR